MDDVRESVNTTPLAPNSRTTWMWWNLAVWCKGITYSREYAIHSQAYSMYMSSSSPKSKFPCHITYPATSTVRCKRKIWAKTFFCLWLCHRTTTVYFDKLDAFFGSYRSLVALPLRSAQNGHALGVIIAGEGRLFARIKAAGENLLISLEDLSWICCWLI